LKSLINFKPTHKLLKKFVVPGGFGISFGRGSYVHLIDPKDISEGTAWPLAPVIIFTGKKAHTIKYAVYDLKTCEKNGLVLESLERK